MMKKKVLFIATVLRGHIMVFHLPYMRWFQEQGFEVHLCCRNDTELSNPQIPYCDRFIEMPFERFPLSKQNLSVYRQLKHLIDSEQYALIHCNTPTGGMLGRLAARTARKSGTKVIYTAHGFHFFTGAPLKNWLLYYPAEKWLSRYTDLLITINQEDYQAAARFHAAFTAMVHGVGVDLKRFQNLPEQSSVLKNLQLPEGCKIITCVGEHSHRKNHEVLILAMNEMPQDVHLLLCGVGELQQDLVNLAEKMHLQDRVHFLGFRNDIPSLLAASHVFAFPSFQEGLPVAQMEAMAAGLPCVVSNVRGNRDLIEEGKGGFLVDPSDAHAFSQKILQLLSNPELCAAMGNQNRTAIEQFSLSNVLREMTVLYQKVLGGDSFEG